MNIPLSIYVALVLCLVTPACETDTCPVAPASHQLEIVPMKLGNTWTQSVRLFDTTGTPFSAGTDSVAVTADSMVGGEQWFLVRARGPEYLYGNVPGYGMVLKFFDGFVPVYRYPAAAGDSFRFTGNTSLVKILATQECVTTEAGTFSCYVYETIGYPDPNGILGGWRSVEYVCPGVGQVKKEFFQSTYSSATLSLSSRIELTSRTVR